MDCKWWPLNIRCEQCNGETYIVKVWVSADAEIRIDFVCPTCHGQFQWKCGMERLKLEALESDLDLHYKQQQKRKDKGIVDPPLLPPAPEDAPRTQADQDKDFEQFMKGIQPPDEEPPHADAA